MEQIRLVKIIENPFNRRLPTTEVINWNGESLLDIRQQYFPLEMNRYETCLFSYFFIISDYPSTCNPCNWFFKSILKFH